MESTSSGRRHLRPVWRMFCTVVFFIALYEFKFADDAFSRIMSTSLILIMLNELFEPRRSS